MLLIGEDDFPFKERVIGGKTYVEGEAGKAYRVRINVYPDADGYFPADYMRVGLVMDGVELCVKKRLEMAQLSVHVNQFRPVSCAFLGYPKDSMSYEMFQFATPDMSSDCLTADTQMGTIKFLVSESHKTGRYYEVSAFGNSCYRDPKNKQIREDKKFWQQASLTTTGGKQMAESKKPDTVSEWVTVRDMPEASFVLRYHTKEVLDFLEDYYVCEQTLQHAQRPNYSNSQNRVYGANNPKIQVIDLTNNSKVAAAGERSSPESEPERYSGQKRPRDSGDTIHLMPSGGAAYRQSAALKRSSWW